MGTFLAIGLATQMIVEKEQLEKYQISIEQLQEEIEQQLYYPAEIYNISDEKEVYYFTLKEDVFHKQLIPLLNTMYPLLYNNSAYYSGIVDELEARPPTEWLQWAETKPEEAFQFDEYGTLDYIKIGYANIDIYYKSILLSMEGKAIMEVYRRQFNFFKYTMMQTFKKIPLSGALRVYLTG